MGRKSGPDSPKPPLTTHRHPTGFPPPILTTIATQTESQWANALARRLRHDLEHLGTLHKPWKLKQIPTARSAPFGYYDFASRKDSEIARRAGCGSVRDVLKLKSGERREMELELNLCFVTRDERGEERESSNIKLCDLLATLEKHPLRPGRDVEDGIAEEIVRYAPHLLHGVTLLRLVTLITAGKIVRGAGRAGVGLTRNGLEERAADALVECEAGILVDARYRGILDRTFELVARDLRTEY